MTNPMTQHLETARYIELHDPQAERKHGTPEYLETYSNFAGDSISLHTDEREDYERDTDIEIESDVLDDPDFDALRDWLSKEGLFPVPLNRRYLNYDFGRAALTLTDSDQWAQRFQTRKAAEQAQVIARERGIIEPLEILPDTVPNGPMFVLGTQCFCSKFKSAWPAGQTFPTAEGYHHPDCDLFDPKASGPEADDDTPDPLILTEADRAEALAIAEQIKREGGSREAWDKADRTPALSAEVHNLVIGGTFGASCNVTPEEQLEQFYRFGEMTPPLPRGGKVWVRPDARCPHCNAPMLNGKCTKDGDFEDGELFVVLTATRYTWECLTPDCKGLEQEVVDRDLDTVQCGTCERVFSVRYADEFRSPVRTSEAGSIQLLLMLVVLAVAALAVGFASGYHAGYHDALAMEPALADCR